MAEEEEIEKIFTIPLRSVKKVPVPKRANYAIKAIKKYVAKHMKGDLANVWIDEPVNKKIWSRGRTNPPSSIRVKAVLVEDIDVIEVVLPED